MDNLTYFFATTDECHHPLKPTYNRTSKKNLQSLSQDWTTLFLEAKVAPFKIESAFYTLQLNTGNGKKVFGKQHQPWAICVFGKCSSMCLCWDLAFFLPYLVRAASCCSSFHPSSFSLLPFHGVFLQYSCCVEGQAIRLWFFQPWNYLESVHCIFFSSSLFMISFSHVSLVYKSFLEPWGPHLPSIMLLIKFTSFENVMVMQASHQVFCRKLPLDIHSWKLLLP